MKKPKDTTQGGMIFPLKVGHASDKQRQDRGERNILNATGWTIARDVQFLDADFICQCVNTHMELLEALHLAERNVHWLCSQLSAQHKRDFLGVIPENWLAEIRKTIAKAKGSQ